MDTGWFCLCSRDSQVQMGAKADGLEGGTRRLVEEEEEEGQEELINQSAGRSVPSTAQLSCLTVGSQPTSRSDSKPANKTAQPTGSTRPITAQQLTRGLDTQCI